MTGSPRPPSFLVTRPRAGAPAARPAAFAPPSQAVAVPHPALRPRPEREEPVGPSPEELARFREEALQRVAHAVEVLRLQAERLAEQARADALEIGFQVARRVLEAELSTSPQALFALVKGALKRAGDSRKVAIRLHPEDVKLVDGPTLAGEAGLSAAAIEVVPDPTLERGDCMVDTDFGKVDGRLRTRLEELHRAAQGAMEEGVA